MLIGVQLLAEVELLDENSNKEEYLTVFSPPSPVQNQCAESAELSTISLNRLISLS